MKNRVTQFITYNTSIHSMIQAFKEKVRGVTVSHEKLELITLSHNTQYTYVLHSQTSREVTHMNYIVTQLIIYNTLIH